ncbi:hypothetical protein LTR54_000506 [Friedmanniomyces endolithicus]|uniref:Rhodopsin domain-containing protein n=1 Tax=Friedmanniomyces endolithicus TaxID=329885 RepID=A0AAN6FAI9_9PEZI|nr:hypothetical protein LTS00_012372 [Friedmanniomyces endolithicus]KAK0312291.1 hypothetical protein LTR82_014087 [Friedmanniomyces endolithicus]KAK1019863.1 hypothetical protein LTR54_000506 [Friedmanniomyces endolithicus]
MSTTLPAGYSQALHPITSTDHGGYASITSGCALVFVLIFAAIRLWNCGRIGHNLDDSVLFAGTSFQVIQSILILIAVDQGFGHAQGILDQHAVSRIDKVVYASDILYVVALYLSKLSILCLEMRLSVERVHVLLAKGSLLVTTAAMVASIVMVAVGCDVRRPWTLVESECTGLYDRWVVIESLGMLAEIFSLVLIVRIYVPLQIHWRAKVRGLSTFGLRMMVVVFVAYRLLSLENLRTSSNPPFDQVEIVAWTQAELAFSLITATLSCLLAFMGQLNSGWGTMNSQAVMAQSQNQSQKTGGGSYELRSFLSGNGKDLRSHKSMLTSEPSHKWTISAPQEGRRSLGSDDSTGMIIRRTVEFSSTTEPQGPVPR